MTAAARSVQPPRAGSCRRDQASWLISSLPARARALRVLLRRCFVRRHWAASGSTAGTATTHLRQLRRAPRRRALLDGKPFFVGTNIYWLMTRARNSSYELASRCWTRLSENGPARRAHVGVLAGPSEFAPAGGRTPARCCRMSRSATAQQRPSPWSTRRVGAATTSTHAHEFLGRVWRPAQLQRGARPANAGSRAAGDSCRRLSAWRCDRV